MTGDAAWMLANGFAVAGIELAGLLTLATGLAVRSYRRSHVARYARRPSRGRAAAPEEGVALLVGAVECLEDEQPGAVLWMSLPAGGSDGRSRRPSIGASPFTLRLPSGTGVRVEPEDGAWSIDTTFTAVERDGACVYEAAVNPGDELHVRGLVQRQHDARAAGTGYRDAAKSWVLRGSLRFASADVIAAHAARGSFHARWAAFLGSLLGSMLVALEMRVVPAVSSGSGPLAALAVMCVGVAYWFAAEETAPWVQRDVRARGSWL